MEEHIGISQPYQVRRTMGVGNSVLIWGNLWLPDPAHSFVQSSLLEGLEEEKVCKLKSRHKLTWDD